MSNTIAYTTVTGGVGDLKAQRFHAKQVTRMVRAAVRLACPKCGESHDYEEGC